MEEKISIGPLPKSHVTNQKPSNDSINHPDRHIQTWRDSAELAFLPNTQYGNLKSMQIPTLKNLIKFL